MSWRKDQGRAERGYHHGNLKEALLQAALDLISKKGPAGFTFADAARMAGVSPAAPYRHFRDRDELIASIAQRGFEQFEALLTQAWDDGIKPLKTFMLKNTDDHELELLTNVAHRKLPANRDQVGLDTLVPAFVLSELKDAFVIGFIIFIPFLVIDIVVSGALMALGMMMMPPVMVSLPFKLLLFVLVDGWALVIRSLVASYH